ncbi:ATP-grasp domain-containing protein [Actinoplanes sp. NPDC049548]|uniref:ATP-grasp domain-containing protein n=1 Tax=Actinoplanes sp. NPDC049548 TaxID=3155152 RepID=UPI0034469557
MSVVVVAVVPASAIRPADIVRACTTCGYTPVFVTWTGSMDPAEHQEYAEFGPVLLCDADRPAEVVPRLRAHTPTAIVTFSEAMIPTTAALAEGLGLPYHDRDVVAALTDKWVQRQRLAEHGVERMWSALVTSREEALKILADRPGPVVVKPKRSQSSRDTYLVDGLELPDAVQPSAERPFVLEEFLSGRSSGDFGDYVSVESLVVDGEPVTLGVTGKFPLLPPFREQGQFLPAHLPDEELAEASRVASAALRAVGVQRGITHTELKLTPDGPKIIEVNGRIGGFLGDLYERATGQDLLALGLAASCGVPVAPVTAPVIDGVHFQYSNLPPVSGGTLRDITGAAQVRQEHGVFGYAGRVTPGATLAPGVMTFFMDLLRGAAPDHRSMLTVIDRCLAHLRFGIERADGTLTYWQAGRDGLRPVPDDR